MRQALPPLLLLTLVATAGAHHAVTTTHGYIGITTRDLLYGPLVACLPDGDGIGGACFDELNSPYGSVTIVVHDDRAGWFHVPLIIYAYDASGLPTDGTLECPHNHGAVSFRHSPFAERIVVGVGPWVRAGVSACPGVGSTGTIDLITYGP